MLKSEKTKSTPKFLIFYKSALQKLLAEESSTLILTSKTVFSISVIVNTISFLVIGIIHVILINAYLFH